MSRARAAVLAAVVESSGPASLVELSSATGLHVNTLREHLEALVEAGLVRREQAAPSGRGRPARLYRKSPHIGTSVAEYAGLASTLAATIHRTSDDPRADAESAGTDWGHDLARSAGRPEDRTEDAARRQVVSVLDGMGFAPEVGRGADRGDAPGATVRLTRCPLLDAARRYPDVVCGVHLGIAKGALQEYGADDSGVSLLPFAEPGACLLHFAGSSRGSSEGA